MRTTSRGAKHVAKLLTLAGAIALAAGIGALGKVLPPGAELTDDVLRLVAEPLDKTGIDVVRGFTSDLGPPTSPRVALLEGMPTPALAVSERQTWMEEFDKASEAFAKGEVGVLAVRTATSDKTTTGEEFLTSWRSASKSKIFLSYTRADAAIAERVAAAFQARGFITFLYLNNESGTPRYSASVVGELFRTATDHLVLDTINARISPGVLYEAHALKQKLVEDAVRRAEEDRGPRLNSPEMKIIEKRKGEATDKTRGTAEGER